MMIPTVLKTLRAQIPCWTLATETQDKLTPTIATLLVLRKPRGCLIMSSWVRCNDRVKTSLQTCFLEMSPTMIFFKTTRAWMDFLVTLLRSLIRTRASDSRTLVEILTSTTEKHIPFISRLLAIHSGPYRSLMCKFLSIKNQLLQIAILAITQTLANDY